MAGVGTNVGQGSKQWRSESKAPTTRNNDNLIKGVSQASTFSNLFSVSREMTAVADDEIVGAIIEKLIHSDGDGMEVAQASEIFGVLTVLGRMSKRSPLALQFLREATSEAYWGARRRWRIDGFSEDYANLTLAGASLKALAIGGRKEVFDEIDRIRGQPQATNWSSAFIDAHYLYDCAQSVDSDTASEMTASDRVDHFIEWRLSPRGREVRKLYKNE
jgi:hypothetical protein